MEINRPEVLAKVEAAFRRCETALTTNNLAVLDELFWDSPHTIRYGAGENLYGFDQIKAFRVARSPQGLMRTLSDTVVTTFGDAYATASTLFRRDGSPSLGRQMQTWVRFPEGLRVVAAHVSNVAPAA